MLSRFWNALPEIGMLNSFFAEKIDSTHIENAKTILGHVRKFTKLRLWYTGFLLSSAVDLVTSFVMSVRYGGSVMVRVEDEQKVRLKNLKKYGTLTSKNAFVIISLPFVAIPVYFGMVRPGTVTVRFLPEVKIKGVHAGGNLYHAEDAILAEPEDVEELQSIILKAVKENRKIMAVGAGRSQGKQFLPENIGDFVIDLRHFNTIEINVKKKVATVGAGVRWIDLQKRANQHKLAVQVMQASNVFSIGGSVGTNVHGWKHTMGALSNTIISMEIINSKGEMQKLTPEDDLFHAVTGGLGLIGIVISVKLQLTDNELLHERSKEVSIADYHEYFYDNVLSNENIRMHLFRLSLDPKNLLSTGIGVDYVLQGISKSYKTPNLTSEYDLGKRSERILIDAAREIDVFRKKYWDDEVKRLLANDSDPLTTNAIMQPPINAMFTASRHKSEWLQEFFLPGVNLDPYIKFLGPLLMDNNVSLFNASVRFIKKDVHTNRKVSPMAYAHDEDRFAIVLCWHQSLEEEYLRSAQIWLRKAQHKAVEMGGTYYLPYQHVSALEDFDHAYPGVNEFHAIKQKHDPDNLFVSGFYQKYMTLRPQQESHIKAIMKNEKTKKEFAGFLDTVLQRVDSNKLYALMESILTYNDTDAEIYQELCKRLPEIMPGTVNSLQRILNSLSTIKEDLGAQAKLLLPDVKEIDGLVEIGYPGRFVGGFQKHFDVKGRIIVVLEQLAMTDYLQTGIPSPYHEFQKLDYNKPDLAGLADESADVITCYIGLHHFPENELDKFLQDVRRVLRPNGHFLLVDHDVVDEMSLHYAKGAHTFFNAVNGISLQDEMNEIRNFHPVSYWTQRLQEHGLGYSMSGPDVPMIRENDPSRNRMVSFQKPGLELENEKSGQLTLVETKNVFPLLTQAGKEQLRRGSVVSTTEYNPEANTSTSNGETPSLRNSY